MVEEHDPDVALRFPPTEFGMRILVCPKPLAQRARGSTPRSTGKKESSGSTPQTTGKKEATVKRMRVYGFSHFFFSGLWLVPFLRPRVTPWGSSAVIDTAGEGIHEGRPAIRVVYCGRSHPRVERHSADCAPSGGPTLASRGGISTVYTAKCRSGECTGPPEHDPRHHILP